MTRATNTTTNAGQILSTAQETLTSISRLEGRFAALQTERNRKIETILAAVPEEFRPAEGMSTEEFRNFLETASESESQNWIDWLGECLLAYQSQIATIEEDLDKEASRVQEMMDGLR